MSLCSTRTLSALLNVCSTEAPALSCCGLVLTMDRLLASAGADHDAYIWNPHVEKLMVTLKVRATELHTPHSTLHTPHSTLHTPHSTLHTLHPHLHVYLTAAMLRQGHAHPLVGIQSVPNSPELITADVSGMFRLWDVRMFQCVQAMVGWLRHCLMRPFHPINPWRPPLVIVSQPRCSAHPGIPSDVWVVVTWLLGCFVHTGDRPLRCPPASSGCIRQCTVRIEKGHLRWRATAHADGGRS
jgi:hypothetical protein